MTNNPVSKPLALRWQGLSKVDWVTVWFFCWKVKTTTSPAWAVWETSLQRRPHPRILNITDHKLWGKFDTTGATHGHVELGSSHLDCDGRKESGKP